MLRRQQQQLLSRAPRFDDAAAVLLLRCRPKTLQHSRAVTQNDLRRQREANAATIAAMKQLVSQQEQ